MLELTHLGSTQTILECIECFYKLPHWNKTITQHTLWKTFHVKEKEVKKEFKIISKLVWKLVPLVKILWTNSSCSWTFLLRIKMKMMEFEVDINFTSPFIVDETILRITMVGNLLQTYLPTIFK